ncbi:type II toxin-antitoxin system RelE/ParE family toxin [Phreatobacter cathodiphilus]|uniref:type II toxin-antitoxin system RelE/ParE family toxin n=1 Tax=Phreatobacter cathodiphilus TaxID=1868589 RepID=UPI0011B1E834
MRLSVLPFGGREGRVANTRELVVVACPYIVVYRRESSAVTVLAVMHTARLWPRRF